MFIAAEQFDVKLKRVTKDVPFFHLDWSFEKFVSFIFAIESDFSLDEISQGDVQRLSSVNDVLKYLQELETQAAASSPVEGKVAEHNIRESFPNYTNVIRKALRDSLTEINQRYNDRIWIAAITPSGSVSTGMAMPYSDIDALIIIHDLEDEDLRLAKEKLNEDLAKYLINVEETSERAMWININELYRAAQRAAVYDNENRSNHEIDLVNHASYAIRHYDRVFVAQNDNYTDRKTKILHLLLEHTLGLRVCYLN